MRKHIFFFAGLLCNLCLYGQVNLVPNPSFDLINTDCSSGALFGIENAFPWKAASQSPDIFDACLSPACCGVPYAGMSAYRPAHSGTGYVGIIQYAANNFREIIQVELVEKLQKQQNYFVCFYAVPQVNTTASELQFADAVGLAFSDTLYTYRQQNIAPWSIPDYVADIENKGTLLNDTAAWTKICGTYQASGSEQFILIGNFRSDAETLRFPTPFVYTYLYIDDVGIYAFDPLPDTLLLCNNDAVQIGHTFLNATYHWNTDATDSTISVNKAGTYIVDVTVDNYTLSDTVVVLNLGRILETLPADTFICKGEIASFTLHAPGNYVWSTGASGSAISIQTPDLYTVTVTNGCGVFTHTFRVESETCTCDIYVPNVFSPNDDGINDYLECSVGCDFPYQMTRFQVFSRWGQLVYTNDATDIQSIKWDGRLHGKPAETGAYIWSLAYEYTRQGKLMHEILSGTITILP